MTFMVKLTVNDVISVTYIGNDIISGNLDCEWRHFRLLTKEFSAFPVTYYFNAAIYGYFQWNLRHYAFLQFQRRHFWLNDVISGYLKFHW
jgi:hypothetical protein